MIMDIIIHTDIQKNERVSFSLDKKKYLNWLEDQFTSDRQKRALLSIIFKYNE